MAFDTQPPVTDGIGRLFVYGSLAPGQPNARLLASAQGTWERAAIHGVLRGQGWAAAMGFPGLVVDSTAGEVPGLLFTSDALDGLWNELDAFEGPGYARVVAPVRRENGQVVTAFVYALSSPDAGLGKSGARWNSGLEKPAPDN